jgi:hypothetical protein
MIAGTLGPLSPGGDLTNFAKRMPRKVQRRRHMASLFHPTPNDHPTGLRDGTW